MIRKKRTIPFYGGSLLAVLALSALPLAAAETVPPRSIYEQRMLEAGFTPENCYLKGRFMEGKALWKRVGPLPKDAGFSAWEFEDGALTAMDRSRELGSVRVEGGALKFSTLGTNACFSWGLDPGVSALTLGSNGFGRQVTHVQFRLRQSLPESKWSAVLAKSNGASYASFSPVTVTGTDWQVVTLAFPAGKIAGVEGPFSGLQVRSLTAGNTIEIDWVRLARNEWRQCYRKTLDLPAAVRWAKVSVSAPDECQVTVNGQPACAILKTPSSLSLRNYEVAPALFHPGTNFIAIENDLVAGSCFWGVLLDAALLCADGTHVRFDSDETWQYQEMDAADADYATWKTDAAAGAGWGATSTRIHGQPEDMLRKQVDRIQFFNPSYKGQIMVAPVDGRAQPIYGSKETAALKVAVPFRAGETQKITYRVFDEMGDGFWAKDKLVQEGKLNLKAMGAADGKDNAATVTFFPGQLPQNVAYALQLTLRTNGVVAETRRYEFAICGPISQPVVNNPKEYTDGMDLKLVWEVDATGDLPPGEFAAADDAGTPRETRVIQSALGKFRICTEGNYISFRYRLPHPGRPHVAIAEFPDDTHRVQEMRLTEQFPEIPPSAGVGVYQDQLGNHTAVLGVEHPLTGRLLQHTVVFFPNEITGTVTFVNTKMAGTLVPTNMTVGEMTAARVGRVRIYEIMNDIPMRQIRDAPGATKWIGQQSEAGPRQIMQSCFASPVAIPMRQSLLLADAPNFYRNWMCTLVNLVKRLRFSGDNCYVSGLIMYEGVFYPSDFSVEGQIGTDGSRRDMGVLMAKLFDENHMGWFAGLEIITLPNKLGVSGADLAQGRETVAQVTKTGQQLQGFYSPLLNWVHPKGRALFEQAMNELIALYGKESGWRGIFLQVNELEGPCWAAPSGDPYDTSYDDYTVALFEKETGVKVPSDAAGAARFKQRYDWIMANAKKEWTGWRCRKMGEIYDWLKQRLKAARPDLALVFYPQATSYMLPPAWEKPADRLPSIFDYSRRGGVDLERIKNDPGMLLAMNVQGNGDLIDVIWNRVGYTPKGRSVMRDERNLRPFADDGKNGVALRINWTEPDVRGPKGWPWTWSETESWPVPAGDHLADYFVTSFVRTHPAALFVPLTDYVLWMGRELEMSRFAKAFRSLPAVRYERAAGEGRDVNVCIASGIFEKDTYGYVANPQWWEVEAELTFSALVQGEGLTDGKAIRGRTWKQTLGPYALRPFRIQGHVSGPLVAACRTKVSRRGIAETRERLSQAEKFLGWLRQAPPENRDLYQLEPVEAMVGEATTWLASNDVARAYDALTISPGTVEIEKSRTTLCAGARLNQAGQLIAKGKGKAACALLHSVLNDPDATKVERANAQWAGLSLFAAEPGGTPAEITARTIAEAKKLLAMPEAPAVAYGSAALMLVNRYAGLNDETNALVYFKILEARPDLGALYAQACGDLGSLYRAQKKLESSRDVLQQGIAAKGVWPQTQAVLLYDLGLTQDALGNADAAQQAYLAVCAQHPADAYPHTIQAAFDRLKPEGVGPEKYRVVLELMRDKMPAAASHQALKDKVLAELKRRGL